MTDNNNGRSNSSLRLRKVAFVAMPFGIKPTGVKPANGPTEVNFDALWERAISGALSTLGYLPIRADNQTGSMIVKDMLEQLLHADLVLADISIPNGNVYYEAGVRHAARERGCILLRADWANPLFDLAQITQLMYPGPPAEPADADYERIEKALVRGIPPLCDSVGPVFELTHSELTGRPQLAQAQGGLLRDLRIPAQAGRGAPQRDQRQERGAARARQRQSPGPAARVCAARSDSCRQGSPALE